MANEQGAGLTGLGKFVSFLLVAGLIALGGYVFWAKSHRPAGSEGTAEHGQTADDSKATDTAPSVDAPPLALAETKQHTDRLPAPQPYKMTGDVVDIELSEYAGYAGLIVANGGLEPNDNSYFKQKHGSSSPTAGWNRTTTRTSSRSTASRSASNSARRRAGRR